MRLTRITGVDLRLFDFDYDLTWMAFFLNADATVYGRYGSRDARSAEGRMSLAGLRHAMKAALGVHRLHRQNQKPPIRKQVPRLAEKYPEAQPLLIRGGCIHCHQVHEFQRAQRKAASQWRREDVWIYPLPENVGLILEVDQGDRVRGVAPASAADRAGIRPGDLLRELNGIRVASQADAGYGLHRAPARGRIPLTWSRNGKKMTGALDLKDGWRKTNLTWRASMLALVPSLAVAGEDLKPGQKKALGLSPRRLAFRQQQRVHSQAQAAGVRAGDIIIGINDRYLEMTLTQFLEFVRQNYLVGDRVTLHILRNGKRLQLPMTLR